MNCGGLAVRSSFALAYAFFRSKATERAESVVGWLGFERAEYSIEISRMTVDCRANLTGSFLDIRRCRLGRQHSSRHCMAYSPLH